MDCRGFRVLYAEDAEWKVIVLNFVKSLILFFLFQLRVTGGINLFGDMKTIIVIGYLLLASAVELRIFC